MADEKPQEQPQSNADFPERNAKFWRLVEEANKECQIGLAVQITGIGQMSRFDIISVDNKPPVQPKDKIITPK